MVWDSGAREEYWLAVWLSMAAPTVTLRNMLGCAEHTAQLPKDGAALKRLVHEVRDGGRKSGP